MFLHDTNLPLLLSPDRYLDPAVHAQELEQLFDSAFHPVALLDELRNDGDFVTQDVLGVPVIVKNISGELCGFVNVCAHRFCKLTDRQRGNSLALRCQYHGWEYDACGATKRIPEAQGFRPIERGKLGLRKLRVETCGEIVFVTLGEADYSLADFLGPAADWLQEATTHFHKRHVCYQADVPVNWKVALENTLESYHLPDVHAATLASFYPAEADCRHTCGDNFSWFVAKSPVSAHLAKLLTSAGRAPREEYHHWHVFPHLTLGMTDMFCSLQWFEPIAGDRCRMKWWLLGMDGSRLPWLKRIAFERWQRKDADFWRRVNDEDLAVLPSVQAGLASRLMPRGGLLSSREERIWHFHAWVQRELGD